MKTLTTLFLLLLSAATFCQPNKHQAHALLLLDIAKNSQLPIASSEYTVSVLGKSPVYQELITYARNVHINGLPIKVTQLTNILELENPQVIFITEDMSHTIADVIRKTSGLPLIVVAEREDLFKAGADISFVRHDKEAFRVNLNRPALEKRNVKISKALYNIVHSTL